MMTINFKKPRLTYKEIMEKHENDDSASVVKALTILAAAAENNKTPGKIDFDGSLADGTEYDGSYRRYVTKADEPVAAAAETESTDGENCVLNVAPSNITAELNMKFKIPDETAKAELKVTVKYMDDEFVKGMQVTMTDGNKVLPMAEVTGSTATYDYFGGFGEYARQEMEYVVDPEKCTNDKKTRWYDNLHAQARLFPPMATFLKELNASN